MKKLHDNCYINVAGWMISRLNLKGNELLCYALIYGFCQDGETRFKGSLSYIASWIACTKGNTINILARLIDKGLVIKYPYQVNNVTFNEYSVNFDKLKDFMKFDDNSKSGKSSKKSSKTDTGVSKQYNRGTETVPPLDNIDNNISPNGGLPTQGSVEENNEQSKPKEKTKSIVTRGREIFEEDYKSRFKENYYWNAKDAVRMKSLIGKLRFQREGKSLSTDDDSVIGALKVFLKMINDKWVLSNYSVSNIDSKFNELVSQARNGSKNTPVGMIIHDNDNPDKYKNMKIW